MLDLIGVYSSCFMLLYGIVWVSLILSYITEVRRTDVIGGETGAISAARAATAILAATRRKGRANDHGRSRRRARAARARGRHLDRRRRHDDHGRAAGGPPGRPRRRRLGAFQAIERRFAWQARAAIIVVGVTGFYMAARLDLWDRFQSAQFWWMHAMVCLWLLFAFVLFVVEPFILRRHFHRSARRAPEAAVTRLYRAHWVLLALSLITIFGAVAGSQGWSVF